MKTEIFSKNFIVITFINLVLFLGFQGLIPTLPMYMEELRMSDSQIGYIVGSFTVSSLIMRSLSGYIMDRAGRKPVFITALLLFAATTSLYIASDDFEILLSIRLLNGLAWGVVSTASSTIATDIIPKRCFGEAMGYFSLSVCIALALSPQAAVEIYKSLGFEGILITVIATDVVILFIFKLLNLPKLKVKARRSYIPYEKKALIPSALMAVVTFAYGAVASFIGIYGSGKGVGEIGLFFTVLALTLLASRPLFGRFVDGEKGAIVCIGGFVFLTGGLCYLGFAEDLEDFLLSGFLFSIGFSASQSALQTSALKEVDESRRGIANGTFFTGFDAGIGLGAVASGIIASRFGYENMFIIIAALPMVTAFVLLCAIRFKSGSRGRKQ